MTDWKQLSPTSGIGTAYDGGSLAAAGTAGFRFHTMSENACSKTEARGAGVDYVHITLEYWSHE